MSWIVNSGGDLPVHVMPIDDLKPHEESEACSCRPRVEDEGRGRIVIHNSWDGREITERAIDAAWAAVN